MKPYRKYPDFDPNVVVFVVALVVFGAIIALVRLT